ncbi:redoxin domain-containing protein [Neolewinella aurantiaca]|uniref:Redoxin domain-containing protein n=1 Tax=Neolewinella aurantiaca TaxID=2602767 RepID=A0A5C7FHQ7_9BACT|nr:redoxin domain-containing protein [Neolewinella aurantiaca]TXF84717.1 redoxin domain-containing protein [Neolewinella aurantiaca]
MLRLTIQLCLLSLLLCSCKTDSAPAAAPEETVAEAKEFKANPVLVEEQEVTTLAIGAAAPDFKLVRTDGMYRTLADYADAEVLVVVFTCNHCPTAQAYEQRLIDFTADYKEKGVGVVAISPNSPLGVMYNELGYSDLDDRYEDMVIRARDADFNFDYLYDGDNQAASLKYGPAATPHTFVFDADRKLRYVGRLDKHEKPGTLNADDLRLAVDELLAGREVSTPETKTFGCSTKWAWKADYKVKDEAQWKALPVTMEDIDVAGVADLLKNDSDNLRLINFWATWCGPCVAEYPDFVVLQRMYSGRNFEFVSISLDKPGKAPAALKFLQKSHSALSNYVFTGEDIYELIEVIDPDWNGAIPFTIMVAPGGDVVYKQQAEVDFLELRRVIVEHPLIGRYF